MRAHWHALHEHLVMTSDRLTFHHDFRQIVARHEVLAGLADPPALFDLLHGPGGDPGHRNRMLRALVLAAQAPDGTAETATVLLLLALWPGLDAVHGRLWRAFRDEPERLASELSARITLGIRRLDLARVSRIAATLIRNTERDIRRDLAGERRDNAGFVPLGDAPADAATPVPLLTFTAVEAGTAADLQRLADAVAGIVGADADLVLMIAVAGATQREAAAALGLGHEAGRKRYRRARAKLRRDWAA
jgi:RNA polymerase sigma-70 factor (ECF subfamily)